jgi:hypothetical protein
VTWAGIALIVFIVLFLRERGHSRRLRHENDRLAERLAQIEGGHSPTQGASVFGDDVNSELDELRERVQVLERIATDENSSEARKAQQIAREIESLRGEIAQRSSSSKEDVSE